MTLSEGNGSDYVEVALQTSARRPDPLDIVVRFDLFVFNVECQIGELLLV
jgi:hypothetical protein